MRTTTMHGVRLLSGVFAATLAGVIAGGCSQSTSSPGADGGSSSGSGTSSGSTSSSGSSGASSSGSSSGVCGGCCNPTNQRYNVDPSRCEPQLVEADGCNGYVCMWTVEVPCFGDAGLADAGSDAGMACDAWCNAAAPANVTPQPCQEVMPLDGGIGAIARCGVCGL